MMTEKILLATDGTDGSEGAFRIARALADRDGASVTVLSVIEPVPLYGVGTVEMAPVPDARLERARSEGVRRQVTEQVARDGRPEWETKVQMGVPARLIANLGSDLDADLIVLGLGAHDIGDRWLGGEVSLKVMRLVDRPVLAAHRRAASLPKTAVVGMDFSPFSLRAAGLAAATVGPEGVVELVHVSPETDDERAEGHREAVRTRLSKLAGEIPAQVTTHLAEGQTARAVLQRAEERGADLIAVGSHGHGFFGRLLMGSVSTRIVRGAHCSVLVAPPVEGEETE